MFQTELFIGFPVDDSLQKGLNRMRPEVADYWINNQKDYLHKAEMENQLFIGKYLEECETTNRLNLVETNIVSLIQKLVPGWTPDAQAAVLFAVSKH
jgi:hypothetical protein